MSEMTHWRVTIKEWNTPHEIVSDNISHMTREKIIEFYGLREPDVEYYRIEEVGAEAPALPQKEQGNP